MLKNGSSVRARSSLAHPDKSTKLQEYDPSAYFARSGPEGDEMTPQDAAQYAALLAQYASSGMPAPYGQYSSINSDINLPNSPTSLTDGSSFDGTMSRTTSLSDGIQMLRIGTNMSSISKAEDPCFSTYHVSPGKPNGLADATHSYLLHGVGFGSCPGDLSSPLSVAAPPMSAASSMTSQDYLASVSTVNHAHESMSTGIQPSSTSEYNKSQQLQPLALRSHRGLQPYPATMQENQMLGHHVAQLVNIASADGTGTRSVASIPRTAYRRPAKQKLSCDQCKDHPQFRGEHELARHRERRHSTVRKFWIAVDRSVDGKFLSNCKHCRDQKKYYAYYNLAAHLRRIHFNKKDQPNRGRKRRGAPIPDAEKKGGKSGGDSPSIEWLKDNGWIKEVDEVVLDDAPYPVDKLEDEDDIFSMGDTAMEFERSIAELAAGYTPAVPGMEWPSYQVTQKQAASTHISQQLQAHYPAMTPAESAFATTYTLGGDFGGQDSYYYHLASQQQYDYSTTAPSFHFMQQ